MYSDLSATNKFAQLSSNLIGLFNQLSQFVVYAILSYNLSYETTESDITQLLFISVIMPVFFGFISELIKINVDISIWLADKRYIDEIMSVTESQGIKKITSIQKIKMDNPKIYVGQSEREFIINQEFFKGDWIFVKGKSGIGKTTLLKSLLGFFESDHLYLNEDLLKNIDKSSLRRYIDYVPQDTVLLQASLSQNIKYTCPLTAKERLLLRNTSFLETLDERDIDRMIYLDGTNISAGQRQRIALARVLFSSADVIILDEVVSHLDQKSGEQLFKELKHYLKEKIVFFTSHHDAYQKYADKIIHLNRGGE